MIRLPACMRGAEAASGPRVRECAPARATQRASCVTPSGKHAPSSRDSIGVCRRSRSDLEQRFMTTREERIRLYEAEIARLDALYDHLEQLWTQVPRYGYIALLA